MIRKSIFKICCDDISLIENYDKAINDDTQTWHCHHRRETDENKTVQQLKDEGLYFNRPANELIFLTRKEHINLHYKNNPEYLVNWIKAGSDATRNKKRTEEYKQKLIEAWKSRPHKMSEETRRKMSEAKKGRTSPIKGKHKSEETRRKMSEAFKGRTSWNKDKHLSEETRKKLSESLKKYHARKNKS